MAEPTAPHFDGARRAPTALHASYASMLALYFVLAAAVFAPFWKHGEVISPDRQAAQLGLPVDAAPARIENRLFNDWSTVFVPEVAVHLHGPRSGWLATWDPYNELGRPIYHDEGLSPAYLPVRVLAWFTDDPLRVFTWLSLLTLLAGGTFAFLWARGRGLHPVAALTAACMVSLVPVVVYWLSFPMFHAVFAWVCGCLYAVDRLHRRIDLAGWTVLAFSAYALLMSGYPQEIVNHAYLLAGYGVYALLRAWRAGGTGAAARLVAACLSAIAVGAACAAPIYVDMWLRAAESSRLAVDPAFFLANLPDVGTPAALQGWLSATLLPELLGNPIAPDFPIDTGGMTLPPLLLGLALAGAVARTRATWGWIVAVAACYVAALSPTVFRVLVEHFGFGLSRSNPIYTAQIPLAILAAHGVDALLRRDAADRRRAGAIAGALAILAAAAVAAWLAPRSGVPVRWEWLGIAGAGVLAIGLAARGGRWTTDLLALVIAVGAYAHTHPLLLSQPPAAIAHDAPLVAALRRHLPADAAYAVVGPMRALPPNLNATLGLRSIHTYNSLSSRRYQAFVGALGGETTVNGRHNRAIGADVASPAFALSGIALVLSRKPLADARLDEVERAGGMRLYRVRGAGCCARFDASVDPSSLSTAQAGQADRASIRVERDDGDHREFVVAPQVRDTTLVLAQAYHPQWRARVLVGDATAPASTFPVLGFLQGVRVPAQATGVTLDFLPWSRWAWLGQAVMMLLLGACLAIALARRARRAPPLSRTGPA